MPQQEAQRVDIGPVVDRYLDRLPRADGLECEAMLGRHPTRCATQTVGDPFSGGNRSMRQVKIKQHRQSVAGDQDVRGLHVHVDQAVRMNARKGLGEARSHPADRLDIRRLLEKAAVGTIGNQIAASSRLRVVEDLEHVAALPITRRGVARAPSSTRPRLVPPR